jgi:uncharacterized membrane protein
MSEQDNVVVVTFDESSKAYEAWSIIKGCAAEGRIGLEEAVVVERNADGELNMVERTDNAELAGTGTGSVLGMLVGVLGGPLGVLVGWGAGAIMGGAWDLRRIEASGEGIAMLSRAIPPGSNAVIASVHEPAVEVLDVEMEKLGGTLTRRPVDEVTAELESAEEAANAAAHEARKTLYKQRKAKAKASADEKVAKAKEKLHA